MVKKNVWKKSANGAQNRRVAKNKIDFPIFTSCTLRNIYLTIYIMTHSIPGNLMSNEVNKFFMQSDIFMVFKKLFAGMGFSRFELSVLRQNPIKKFQRNICKDYYIAWIYITTNWIFYDILHCMGCKNQFKVLIQCQFKTF